MMTICPTCGAPGGTPAWTPIDDNWECPEIGGYVQFVELGSYAWGVVESTPITVGPYPGSPDWIEREVGMGIAATAVLARWEATRCAARDAVLQDVLGWEEAEFDDRMEREQAAHERALAADYERPDLAPDAFLDLAYEMHTDLGDQT